jgi:hypothetical protein
LRVAESVAKEFVYSARATVPRIAVGLDMTGISLGAQYAHWRCRCQQQPATSPAKTRSKHAPLSFELLTAFDYLLRLYLEILWKFIGACRAHYIQRLCVISRKDARKPKKCVGCGSQAIGTYSRQFRVAVQTVIKDKSGQNGTSAPRIHRFLRFLSTN